MLLVADGKHGAGAGFGACARVLEEFFGDALHDLPLRGGGVLGFVDEDVIEAAVELEQDPGGTGSVAEQVGGLDDEVFEVERGAGGFG